MQTSVRRISRAMSLVAMLLVPMLASVALAAAGDTPKSVPDLSGVWEVAFGSRTRPGPGIPEQPALTAEYAQKLAAFKAAQAKGEDVESPQANCVPPGMPAIMNQPYPMELLFTPGKVTIVIEAYSQTRRIFMDGRKHPDDPDLTYNGHSIGHWEGDTLVVDSVGFTPDTALGPSQGYRHSDQMHIVERFRLTAPQTMEVVTTIDDAKALTKPFSATKVLARHRDWDITEYICEQNNRNLSDDKGKAGIILTH
ncbi:MAG TPA: hypothetical protein VK727_18040 [Steroidobacteraceae bacterium]|nr:hypothetical protein [Steroidobacteraceae bacterium]